MWMGFLARHNADAYSYIVSAVTKHLIQNFWPTQMIYANPSSPRRIRMSNDVAHLIMRPHRRRNVDITLPLKNQADITPPKLKITDLLPFRERHPLLRRQYHGAHLRHPHRQHRHKPDRRLQHHEPPRLRKLIPRRIRRVELAFRAVHGPVRDERLHPVRVGDRHRVDLEVDVALDVFRPDDFAAQRCVLPVIVLRTEERVDEESAVELVLVRAVLEQLLDVPVQTLDRDARIGADLELPAVGAVGRADDDARIADRGDGAISWLHGAGEPVVEITPAATRLNILLHVVWRRVPECLDFGDGLRVIKPVAELLGVFVHPVREPGVSDVDSFGLDGVLEVFDGGLVHDEVEEADAVVDVAAFFVFLWDPIEPFVDLGKILRDGGDGLHLDDAAVMGASDGGVEARLPSWGVFDFVFEGLDDWVEFFCCQGHGS